MKIERYIVGLFQTNTYLLSINDECILIDPASKPEKMIEILADRKLVAILLTHGHFDHIKAVDELARKYNCPVYLNKNDKELVKDRNQGSIFNLEISATVSVDTVDVKEGISEIGPFKFETIYTPGHTKGSVCYKFDKELFTGDTLFRCSAGRTDLPGGSDKELKSSLRIIKDLYEDLIIYPGHEDTSTLEYEKLNNPYLMYI